MMPTSDTPPPPSRPRRFSGAWLIAAAVAAGIATVAIGALLTNIASRKAEGMNPFFRVVEITDTTTDPAVWGRNFPVHYDLYSRTVDMTRTRYGGSEAMPTQPSAADPRDTVAQSRLDEDPRLREFWAGYAFAEDFREERGHSYMLLDQVFTRRQDVAKQPGTCLHCHASVYVPYLKAGNGDLMEGFARVNQMPYAEAVGLVEHPVSCIDCHDPENMSLRVTRPAFMEGMRALKAAQGIDDYDVNEDATRSEMRAFVCGQCHVEYYFKGPEKRLTYPWARGLNIDSIMAYYDEDGHNDWTHAISGAPVLKAQHPEFEMWNQGVHARSGVTCADCHMPYIRMGAQKVSDHWVRSPLLNVNNACQTCHKWSEEELRSRVHTIQDRTYEMRNAAIDATLALAKAIGAAAAADSSSPRLAEARRMQKRAQFYTDFVEAENSMGFHADQEAVRILGKAIDFARRGELALQGRTPVAEQSRRDAPVQSVTPAPAAR
jgi:nitrite reductase (cytochrome c-552)